MTENIGLSLIVAMAQNRVIGRDNTLPWRLPKDLAYFKKITLGHPIIMGRKTFDSIGRALPGRTNIVVTRQSAWCADGVERAGSLEQAMTIAKSKAQASGLTEVMLIGGESLYAQALEIASRLYITEVKAEVEGDTLFPQFDESQWLEIAREDHAADEKNAYKYSFVTWDRKQKC